MIPAKESIIWGKFLMESFEPPMEAKEKRLENPHATASSVCNWQSGGDVHNAASVMVPWPAPIKWSSVYERVRRGFMPCCAGWSVA
jgi:hypothetical protein